MPVTQDHFNSINAREDHAIPYFTMQYYAIPCNIILYYVRPHNIEQHHGEAHLCPFLGSPFTYLELKLKITRISFGSRRESRDTYNDLISRSRLGARN